VSLLSFVEWIAATRASVAMHESIWMFPIVESVHVLGLCLFLGIAVLWDLRLLGVTFGDVPALDMNKVLMPWMWIGAVVMVLSGIAVYLNDPIRYYNNVFFRLKAVMLVLAVLNAWVFEIGIFRRIADWERDRRTPVTARLAGVASLVLWAAIVIAGRMIAYNWFDKK
jgi:hypothetical protein